MTLARLRPHSRLAQRNAAAFTLAELMVAMGIAGIVLGVALVFTTFAATTMSSITAQTTVTDQASKALQLIQSRSRLATSISNDVSGGKLTLGFDDNFLVDSDGDKLAYNDRDHFEVFQVIGTSSNLMTSTNSMVYIAGDGSRRILIPTGVGKLPGQNIFTVTNRATALIRFAIVDTLALDRYQSIDIQSTTVILNRRMSTNTISILP